MATTTLLGSVPIPEDSDPLEGAAAAMRAIANHLDEVVVVQASDETWNNDAVLDDVAGMDILVEAGKVYQFEAHLLVNCASGGVDAKVAVRFPTGSTCAVSGVGLDPATTGSDYVGDVSMPADPAAPGTGWAFEFGVPNGTGGMHLYGILTAADDGTLGLRFSQKTATATNTVLKAGSYMKARVVP